MTITHSSRARITAASLAAVLGLGALGGLAACSDEDGDGGTTDEEIQDGRDAVTSVVDEVKEEVDAQDEGSNSNNYGE